MNSKTSLLLTATSCLAIGAFIGNKLTTMQLSQRTMTVSPISKEVAKGYVEKYMSTVSAKPDNQKVGYLSMPITDFEQLSREARNKLKAKDADVINIYFGEKTGDNFISYIIGLQSSPSNFFVAYGDKVTCPKQCDITQTNLFK